jgi:hypothetical protein
MKKILAAVLMVASCIGCSPKPLEPGAEAAQIRARIIRVQAQPEKTTADDVMFMAAAPQRLRDLDEKEIELGRLAALASDENLKVQMAKMKAAGIEP